MRSDDVRRSIAAAVLSAGLTAFSAPAQADICDAMEAALKKDAKLFVNAMMANSNFFSRDDCGVYLEDNTAFCAKTLELDEAREMFGKKLDPAKAVGRMADELKDCGLEITRKTVGSQSEEDHPKIKSVIYMDVGIAQVIYDFKVFPDGVTYEVWLENPY